ncbi:hypothetical protein [Conexibacter sp. S30A1]|uniref:hypothetical protein n=1 Tax=Conexibacter sp. S30A1 TaxID=2937800 RepID=UPI00200ECA2C|nr:hypothetical protein [Conexibacter sp. S30A1]
MRALERIVVALAVSAVALGAVAGGASATQPMAAHRGELTATEYRQLNAELTSFKRVVRSGRLTWSELYASCRKVGESTALLRSVRSNCNTGFGVEQALAGFNADAQRCAALTQTSTGSTTGTSTTGTSTTPSTLTPAQLSLIACLEPEYQAISRATGSLYERQAGLRRQVLLRGFSGRCLLTLAPTIVQLKRERTFLATSRRLVHDVVLISRVAAGTLPAGALNVAQITADASAFMVAGKAVVETRRPQNLAVCPHA